MTIVSKIVVVVLILLLFFLFYGVDIALQRTTQPAFKIKHCSDFSTAKEAQDYMHTYDAKYLDGDDDGTACNILKGK